MAELKKKVLGKDVGLATSGGGLGFEVDLTEGVKVKKRIPLKDIIDKGWKGFSKSKTELEIEKRFELPFGSVSISGKWKEGGNAGLFANINIPLNKGGSVKKYAKGGSMRKVRYD